MMMISFKKQHFILFLLLGTALGIKGQSFEITGSLQSEKGESILFTPVMLMNANDSTLVKGLVSNESGKFEFKEVGQGKYFIVVKNISFHTFKSKAFEVTNQNLNFPAFILKEANKELEEVEVTAQKQLIEVRADKTIFNVQDAVTIIGTNGFNLLRKAPGVVIDSRNNIIVEGKSGVQILINGKPSILAGDDLVNYLKSLQTSNIAAIEIITQPSSKYDAEGTAGIINIKLKKGVGLGTNATLGLGYAYGRYGKYTSNLSFNSRSEKFNVFGNYSNWFGQEWEDFHWNREQFGAGFNLASQTLDKGQNHNGQLGIDFLANEKHAFGLMLDGTFFDFESNTSSRTPIVLLDNQETLEVLRARSENLIDFYYVSSNFNYRYENEAGNTLTLDLDYGKYDNQSTTLQPNFYYNPDETIVLDESTALMKTPNRIDLMSAKADYEQQLGQGTLALGIKFSQIKANNTFQFFEVVNGANILDTGQSNDFLYTENINAAYVNYQKRWKKLSFQAGLRVEQTISEGKLESEQNSNNQRVQRNYTDLFPSGGFTYTPDSLNVLSLTYSRRITRPDYEFLNPFEIKVDELTFERGNPFLQPQYVHNLKLSYTYAYALSLSVSYSNIQDFFAEILQAEGSERMFSMQQNVANQKIWNVNMTLPLDITNWWTMYLNMNYSHNSFEGQNEGFRAISQNTFDIFGQNQFALPKGFKLELLGWYSSPLIEGGTFRINALGALDIGIQKSLMKDKLTLAVALSDIFYTSPWRGNMSFGDLRITGNGAWESRQIRFNVSYNFGNKNVRKSRERKLGIDDEKNRLKQDK